MHIIFQTWPNVMFWFSVTIVCLLGAMSPGPSLAIIINHSLSQGKIAGFFAAVAHGVGIGLFAFATVFGLVVAVDKNPLLFDVIQTLGSLFLLYLAAKLLLAPIQRENNLSVVVKSSYWAAARDGFLIALVNPKIIIFFTALFSQFVRPESDTGEKLALTVIAGGIDMLWYILVVLLLSRSASMAGFYRKSWLIDKAFGFVLAIISIYFITQILQRGGFI